VGPHPPADRQEMFQLYVSMGDARSYQKVADHYGVAKNTVVRIAVDNEWLARIKLIEAEARREADRKLAEMRTEAYERHMKLAKFVQSKAVQGLQAHAFDSARDASRALVEGVKLERTVLGESTGVQTVTVQQLTRREVETFVTGSLFPDEDSEAEEELRDAEPS
jgi:transposase-like protein